MIPTNDDIVRKVNAVLGVEYVKHIDIDDHDTYIVVKIHYDSVFFRHESESLNIFFGTHWSTISHRNEYMIIRYTIRKEGDS